MTRKRKLILNTSTALLYQFITIVCGFVLPKFVIPYFGSATNGMINSINQFLAIITLCECGIGAVVQSALYKPLAEKNDEEISKIMIAAKRFFNIIMAILFVYVFLLMIFYPLLIYKTYSYDFLYTSSLIFILALSNTAQSYLFIYYSLLLNADQLSFVKLLAHTVVLILNTVVTIILIYFGASVHTVKLVSALIFFIQPIAIKVYVDKHYNLNMKLKFKGEPIKQKWNGFAQHIASVVLGNTDTIVLTTLSTLENVSIYSVYYLVTHGIRQVIVTLNSGIQAMLGNMYAKDEKENLDKTYSCVEMMFHFLVTFMFTVTGILLIPFVRVYTQNFTDANYVKPVFGVLITMAYAAYCLRVPYEMMIKVAGHYKQTQISSIIEAVINVIASVVLVFKFGLEGVAIGTLLAMTYRTIYLVWYLSKTILYREVCHFLKHIIIDFLSIIIMILLTKWIKLDEINYISWIFMAIKVGSTCFIVTLSINLFFYKDLFLVSLKQFFCRKNK